MIHQIKLIVGILAFILPIACISAATECCIGKEIKNDNNDCVSAITAAECNAKIKSRELQIGDCKQRLKELAETGTATEPPPCRVQGIETSDGTTSSLHSEALASRMSYRDKSACNICETCQGAKILWGFLGFVGGVAVTSAVVFAAIKCARRNQPDTFFTDGSAASHKATQLNHKVLSESSEGRQRNSQVGFRNQSDMPSKTTKHTIVAADQTKGKPGSGSQDLMDKALHIMENLMTKIDDVDSMMRDVFSLTAQECEITKNSNGHQLIPTIREGFMKWREKEGDTANIQTLVAALRRTKKNAIADEIRDTLNIREDREDAKERKDELDAAIRICEKIIPVDDKVKEFFRCNLELESQEVDRLLGDKKTFVRIGLMKWKEYNTKENATVKKLLQHFTDADMNNYADKIREKLQNGNLEPLSKTEPHVKKTAAPSGDTCHMEHEREPLIKKGPDSCWNEDGSEAAEEIDTCQNYPCEDGKRGNRS